MRKILFYIRTINLKKREKLYSTEEEIKSRENILLKNKLLMNQCEKDYDAILKICYYDQDFQQHL